MSVLLFCSATATPETYTLSLTTLFRSHTAHQSGVARPHVTYTHARPPGVTSLSRSGSCDAALHRRGIYQDRKSTRLNSSHMSISYAVFCLKKKTINY